MTPKKITENMRIAVQRKLFIRASIPGLRDDTCAFKNNIHNYNLLPFCIIKIKFF